MDHATHPFSRFTATDSLTTVRTNRGRNRLDATRLPVDAKHFTDRSFCLTDTLLPRAVQRLEGCCGVIFVDRVQRVVGIELVERIVGVARIVLVDRIRLVAGIVLIDGIQRIIGTVLIERAEDIVVALILLREAWFDQDTGVALEP